MGERAAAPLSIPFMREEIARCSQKVFRVSHALRVLAAMATRRVVCLIHRLLISVNVVYLLSKKQRCIKKLQV